MIQAVLEDRFDALLAAAYSEAYEKEPSSAWRTAMSMRAGTHGGSVATLENAGDAIGVSRERVRQIMAKIAPYLKGAEIPELVSVAEAVTRESPAIEPIGGLLSRLGLTRPNFSGDALLNIMALVGTTSARLVGADLVSVDGWVVDASDMPLMQTVPMARKHTSKYGMTTAEEIRQAVAMRDDPHDLERVRRILQSEPSVKWHGEWLWVEKETDGLHSNRLVNCARTILAVNSPQTVSSIQQGARREWKFRKLDILPPVEAMWGFFEKSPHFLLSGQLVSPVQPLDYHNVLGGVAAAMVDVLKSAPSEVMDRRALQEACADAGLKSTTVGIWTTFAEWMENVAPNVWGLRGANPNPAVVNQIRATAKARKEGEARRRGFSWAPDGTLQVIADVTASMLASGTITFDTASHEAVAGRRFAITYKDADAGSVKVGDEHYWSWGWGKVLGRSGAKVGDVLRADLNLIDSSAIVIVGGQELWE